MLSYLIFNALLFQKYFLDALEGDDDPEDAEAIGNETSSLVRSASCCLTLSKF